MAKLHRIHPTAAPGAGTAVAPVVGPVVGPVVDRVVDGVSGTPSSASPSGRAETPTERLDRITHNTFAQATGGLSPISLALAWADWAWHLGVSPGRRMELAARAAQAVGDTWRAAAGQDGSEPAGDADDDPRFRHPAWAQWPYSALRAGFRNAEAFWREAAVAPGMTAHHAEMTRFFARQWLGVVAPANWLATNPVVQQDALESGGAHLAQGAMNWLRDATGQPDPPPAAAPAVPLPRFEVGQEVAVTPGEVVYRNRLIELIRYTPATERVHEQPLLVIPSWIMKYYILDLSPHNSMVRYLVGQGQVVYMLSWRNPDADDHALTMDDYLRLGVFDALAAVGRLHGEQTPVHAMGYCLGGTLLAMAAAALGHGNHASAGGDHASAGGDHASAGGKRTAAAGARAAGGKRVAAPLPHLPPLASLTLLAAQTDFSEPGELGLFIDESQVGYLDEITRSQGYLKGSQMAGSFQFLHSRELVWTRRMREYLMGEREQKSDLMAWNADTTRMPARMHHEYLTALYLHNALATSSYRVGGHAVSLGDIRMPLFMVGTERDHISPWRSVYKLHHLCDAEITFVLTSGGHNAGIISEPGHAGRSYRIASRPARGAWMEPDEWLQQAAQKQGSWWPAWQAWLAARSGPLQQPRPVPQGMVLGPAPGTYVMQRYEDD